MFLHWNPKSKRTLKIAPTYPNIVRIFTSESGSKMHTEIDTKCTHAGVVLASKSDGNICTENASKCT